MFFILASQSLPCLLSQGQEQVEKSEEYVFQRLIKGSKLSTFLTKWYRLSENRNKSDSMSMVTILRRNIITTIADITWIKHTKKLRKGKFVVLRYPTRHPFRSQAK